MVTLPSTDDYRTVTPGVELRVLCHGAATMLTEFRLAAGHEVAPGDSWRIAGGTGHGATILEDSVAVEVSSPVRDDDMPVALA